MVRHPVRSARSSPATPRRVRLARRRVESALPRVRTDSLGGTSHRTGLKHASGVRGQGSPARLSAETKLQIEPRRTRSSRRATATRSSSCPGALKVLAVSLTKIAQDLALMGSGPRAGDRRDLPARIAEGLLDHAGEGQPGDPEVVLQVAAQAIGNDTAITIGRHAG